MRGTVVCDAGSHAGKVWEVERFRNHPAYDGDTATGWKEAPRYTRAELRALEKRRRKPALPPPPDATDIERILATIVPSPQSSTSAAELWEDSPLPPFVAVTKGEGVRHRNSLRCELCGDNVPARREKLDPILDRLAEEGSTSITLRFLRAIL